MAVSLEQFTRQLADSGVLSEQDLRTFLDKLPDAEKPVDGEQLAKRLVKEKKISAYQAQVVYSGKGKSLTMGSYFVMDKLGQGGMGMVLKAEHRMMKRLVAIKVLSPAVTKTKELSQRFQREVEAAARLTHPNIVGAFDAGETNGSPFLVMEYVPGDDLASIVKKKGPLSVDQAIDCIAQAAKGLDFAHNQGVIHRDIKPANLLLDTSGVVKILDMGLARIEATDVATQADLTGTGAVMGTVDYMAPEQALSTKHADARSDLYSLGISLWYLLTGKAAYEGDSLMARLLAHREQPIPSLRVVRGDIPESLDHVFEKLVAKKQADRYQTATELIADLQSCRTGASIKAVTVAEVVTGPDEFQNFLQHIDSPTEGPRGSRSNPSMTGTKTVAKSQASVTSADETTPPTPASETQRFRRPKSQKAKAPPWFQDRRLQIAGGAAALLVLLAAVFLFQTPNGTLRVEILDPEVEMTVKGTDLKFHGADLDPVSLKVGEKKLLVTRGDLTFPTESFEIKKGKETRVKVELIGDNLVVNSGGKVIADQPIRQKALTTSTTKEINRPGISAPTTSVSEIATSGAPAESKFALQFDGTGLVEVEDVPMLPSVVCTLEMWVTPEAFPISFSPLVIFEDDQRALILHSEKKYRFYSFHNEAVMNDEAKLSQRVHLAGVNDGIERRLYLNGKLVGKKDEPGMLHPTPKNSKRVEIGSAFTGTIDGLRISSSARYDRDFVPESDWKADDTTEVLYQFNEGQGDVLKDLSRHGRPGRIKGAKWVRLEGRKPGHSNLQDGAQAPKPAIAPFDAAQARKHQEAWATYLNVPVEFTNSIGMKFRLIPPGEFTMGSTQAEIEATLKESDANDKHWQACIKSEAPQHKVILTQPIYLGVDEVTQAEYTKVMGTNPSQFSTNGPGKDRVAGLDTSRLPVEGVSWSDAAEFCAKLSQQQQLKPFYFQTGETITPLDGTGYRLPSEAEWEFACRAGTVTKNWIGDQEKDLARAGWFAGNSGGRTHSPGELTANPFGLFEMHGNVWEWVQDGWSPTSYGRFQEKPVSDPNNSFVSSSWHSVRGGSWNDPISRCRASRRLGITPTARLDNLGFRVALPVEAAKQQLSGSRATAPKPAIAPFDAAQARKHQEAWATYLNVPVEFTNSIGMKFRLIPPGEFMMGITPEQLEAFRKIVPDEDGKPHMCLRSAMPGHLVRLTRPIYMQVDQVRLSQYTSLLGREPADAELDRNDYLWRGVNWHDAIEFCNKLGEREKRQTVYTVSGTETRLVPGVTGYRLPTEAEFEFACRAGTDSFFYFGNDGAVIMDHVRNHALEHVQANPFGLIELYGSTTNWCWDATPQNIESYPAELLKQANDPVGHEGPNRITRGGAYFAGGGGDRSQNNSYRRNSFPPDLRGSAGLGRVVLMIPERPAATLSKPAATKSSWQDWPIDAPLPAIAPFDAAQAKKHQEAWAVYLKRPVEFTNTLGMKFTLIPPGEFLMGCDEKEIAFQKLQLPREDDLAVFAKDAADSLPKHAVRITRPFYMQTHEITNGLYKSLLGNLPADNDPAQPDSPVLKNVTLVEATAFCDAVSKKEGKIPSYRKINGKTTRVLTANGYRLPTEAEWEYACRAGTTTFWFFGDVAKSEDLFDYQTIRRGSAVKPNPFGLIDMYGGSSEWCFDRHSPYLTDTVVDPFTEPEGETGVARGGSMFSGGGGELGTINSVIRGPSRVFGFHKHWFGLGRVVLPIEWNPASVPSQPAP